MASEASQAASPVQPAGGWVGQALARREDPALLTGRGQYVDDVAVPAEAGDPLHACVVRSPVAHARIVSVDADAAVAAPGVVAVFTAADLDAAGVGPLPGAEGLPPGSGNPAFPVLARDKVVWAGQPVALVVASSAALAADAAELVDVSYEELAAVTTPLAAAAPAAPVLHAELASNIVVRKRITAGDADAAFARAAHRVGQRMTSQRVAPVALEPRGVLAWVSGSGRLEVRLPTQRPHGARGSLAATLGVPAERVRVSAGDVGGGFGTKGPLYPDQVAVCFAAMTLGRPVKWMEQRSESFLATFHGRDQVADLEMALDADGRITALRGVVHASFGAYFTANAPSSLLSRLGPMLPQAYRIESFDVELVGVLANTTPIAPYRGAGRPEAAYFCERLVDLAAAQAGLGPAELRRRNFLSPSDFPYRTCTGLVYDSGDYGAGLELMLARLGYRDFGAGTGPDVAADAAAGRLDLSAERGSLRASTGELLGVGIASFVEPGGITPGGPTMDPLAPAAIANPDAGDKATVTVSPAGTVTVAVGTSGHGQGHETAFAQLAADLLGVPYEDVTVVFGDTDTSPFGFGTFGSRSAVAGGTAIYHACQAVLEAARRVDAPMPVAEAAARLGGLSATAASGAPPETYASGSYGCVVAVDPLTGRVRVLRVVAVDDCGVVINPLLVEGQVHGAIAQGLGQALTEQVLYDQAGQPMSGSLMDYAVPFAATMPAVLESYLVCTPSPANPLGVKGMGESGTIGVIPAVVNAVMDALRPYGIRHLDMPLTAEKVWTAIRSATALPAPVPDRPDLADSSSSRLALEQVAAQEGEFRGHDRLMLVEERRVMRAVDLEDLTCRGTAGGLQRRCREDGLVAGADHR
jgi:carbon-monoxide dehydrogenase large subunit